ncbi:magnesium and cobalt transport protein CorA [Paludibacter sp. 221]|uniref:magnesium/cobalt transporter CorA n=1 Tax=Paludibacter sp. 221 TaxID=2302939 RepID=UPI0013D54501|nr:magnesium/cobalt transporter CorA [Paludibacter sp. 221]NDV47416.1 magnesium and cobalt transport protein CorA [Paludibacter sp. 221]
MARYTRKKREDIGLSPYALVFRGQQKVNKVGMQLIDYNTNDVRETEVESVDDLRQIKDSSDFSWLNVNGLHDAAVMENIASVFDIPANIMSDVMNPDIRPKLEDFGTGVFITLKTFQYHKRQKRLSVDNFSLIIFENTLISFQEQPGTMFNPVRERIRKYNKKIRTAGSDYLAFALLDIIIDNYIYIMGIIGDKIEILEDYLYDKDEDFDKDILQKVNVYKRELSYFRRHIKPAREMIANLVKLDSDCLHDENNIHFRELLDNMKDANDISDTYREMLYDLVNIYHTSISTKLNDIMKVLTIISVIFIPITFIVGVYGTNFEYIPELGWKYGYIAMWVVMAVVVIGMLWYFKRKKWF